MSTILPKSRMAEEDIKPGRCEVLAVNGGEFMRYDGEAVAVKGDALTAKVREISPQNIDKVILAIEAGTYIQKPAPIFGLRIWM